MLMMMLMMMMLMLMAMMMVLQQQRKVAHAHMRCVLMYVAAPIKALHLQAAVRKRNASGATAAAQRLL